MALGPLPWKAVTVTTKPSQIFSKDFHIQQPKASAHPDFCTSLDLHSLRLRHRADANIYQNKNRANEHRRCGLRRRHTIRAHVEKEELGTERNKTSPLTNKILQEAPRTFRQKSI